jgi:hypothetical protein
MEFATVDELNGARAVAEDSLDLLRIVTLPHYREAFSVEQIEFDADREKHVGEMRRFSESYMLRITQLIACGPVHEWFPWGTPSQPTMRTERVLRTIERSSGAKLFYPFGEYHNDYSPGDDARLGYTSAHALALHWVHNWAAGWSFSPDQCVEEIVTQLCDDEHTRESLRYLCSDHDLAGISQEQLRSQLVNEWRLALEFVIKQSDGLFSTIIERANDSDRDILQALVELEREGRVPATSADIAKAAGRSEQKTKEATGALYRFGLLDRGPNGTGYRLSDVGTRVATQVGTSVGTD